MLLLMLHTLNTVPSPKQFRHRCRSVVPQAGQFASTGSASGALVPGFTLAARVRKETGALHRMNPLPWHTLHARYPVPVHTLHAVADVDCNTRVQCCHGCVTSGNRVVKSSVVVTLRSLRTRLVTPTATAVTAKLAPDMMTTVPIPAST